MAQHILGMNVVLRGRVDNTFGQVGDQIAALGAQVSQISQALISLGGESLEVYRNYEDGILETRSVLAKQYTNSAELDRVMASLEEHAQQWAGTTIFHTDDVSSAMAKAATMAWSYEQMLEGIPSAMLIAQAGNMDLLESVDDLGKMLAATNTDFEDSDIFIDQWARAADTATTNIPELGDAFLRLGAAAQFADSTAELFTMLDVLANVGTVGEGAGTAVRNMMIRLIAPTKKAADAMEALGVSEDEISEAWEGIGEDSEEAYARLQQFGFSPYDEDGNLRSFIDIFTDLSTALDQLPTEQEQNQLLAAIFPTRTISYAKAMLAAVRDGSIYSIYDAIWGDSEGYAGQKADIRMSGLTGSVELFGSKWEELKRKIGEALSPEYEKGLSALGGFIDKVNNMPEGAFNILLGGLEGIAAVGPALMIGAGAVKLIGAVAANPVIGFTLLAAAVGGVAAATYNYVNAMEEADFESRFGEMDLDTQTLSAHLGAINASFLEGYSDVRAYASALDTAVGNYKTASSTISGELLTAMLTGSTLSASDIENIEALGQQMGAYVQQGIQASFDMTTSYLTTLFGGEDASLESDEYLNAVGLNAAVLADLQAKAQETGESFGEMLSSAIVDGLLTEDEYAAVMAKMQAYNDAFALAAAADRAGDMAVALNRAQNVSIDSFETFAADSAADMNDTLAQLEEDYVRARAWQETYYQYAIENGLKNPLTGEAYTEEDWNATLAAMEARHAAETQELVDQNAQVLATAFNAVMESSGYADAWEWMKGLAANGAPLWDEGDQINWENWGITDADMAELLGEQIGSMYRGTNRGSRLIKMLSPYADNEEIASWIAILEQMNRLRSGVTAYENRAAIEESGIGFADTSYIWTDFDQQIAASNMADYTLDSLIPKWREWLLTMPDWFGALDKAEAPIELPDGGEAAAEFVAEAQNKLDLNPGNWYIYMLERERTGSGKGGMEQNMYAEGGRATVASIFGEDGAEWAIPEEHSQRTAALLDAARRASGFTWADLIARNGGLNAQPDQAPRTFVYAPVIHAADARGVREALAEDKARFEKWWAERRKRDEVEVYA